ncbi:MAG: Dabb family protein [Clostridia bacterium]|nr:Dabb family protein [Clostridia bacterium]
MIRHMVMFRFKEEAEGRSKAENVAMTREKLLALKEKIPYILNTRVEINAAGASGENADLLLISDFESFETLNAYIVHPDHVAVGAFMSPLKEGRQAIDLLLD